MAERAFKCPQCNGPLAPGRFASSVDCPYCGARVKLDEASVSASAFRTAFRAWNSPASHGYSSFLSIGDDHWATLGLIAHGEISDVYRAERARWPTERVLVKVLRDRRNAARFDHEWDVASELQGSEAQGAAVLASRLPQPVARGEVREGSFAGAKALIFRWASGFLHTFEDVRRQYPSGIEPRASLWVWRRVLETLAFLHSAGVVHGALVPQHLLVQENEHGVRLVGLSRAGHVDEPGAEVPPACEPFYEGIPAGGRLVPSLDVKLSARCIASLLGGDPKTGAVPARVPVRLADTVRSVASADHGNGTLAAWELREQLGALAREAFGVPTFCPIAMPR